MMMRLNYPALSSLAIVGFLGFFQPFRVSQSSLETILWSLLIIGLVHGTFLFLYQKISRNWRLASATSEMLGMIPFFLCVALATKVIHVTLDLSQFTTRQTVEWFYGSLLTLPIPHLIRRYGMKKPILGIGLTEDFYGVKLLDIIYFKALENYVELWYLAGVKVENKIIRTTMTKVEKKVPQKFLRAHRSYIFNTSFPFRLLGNSRQAHIVAEVAGSQIKIPISGRKYATVKHIAIPD